MESLLKLLTSTALFKGFAQEEIGSALLCLNGQVKRYTRKQRISGGDESLQAVGLILSGLVYVSRENEAGGQAIHYEAVAGDIIGEASLLSASALGGVDEEANEEEGLTIIAAEDCELLLIETKQIMLASRGNGCQVRSKIIENLLRLIVASNRDLHRKLDLMSHRSLRGRIMHYLKLQARRQQSHSFKIPFSRAEFADYLLVDRSALSRELCRMSDDGLITFSRNEFKLLKENML